MTATEALTLHVDNACPDFTSYRAARVKSMFNVERGNRFTADVVLELGKVPDWQIGLVVGPSGSGKSSIGRLLAEREPGASFILSPDPDAWPEDEPIIDAIHPGADDFDGVTGALSAVGLGDVPAWLRPYPVLSTGERFRADLARVVAEAPAFVVVDEFTSVVDRQIAKVGASAFGKAWRRGGGQAVLLSCHYDIAEWLAPDWVYDTADGSFEVTRGHLQRPAIEVEIRQADGHRWWPLFKPHHYLDVGPMPFSKSYVAFVGDDPVAHLGMSSKGYARNGRRLAEARACRMVVMPEWQGAGVGTRFLNHVAQHYLDTGGHLAGPCTTQFHTSHPGLVAALRRDRKWRQVSASGVAKPAGRRSKSVESMMKAGSNGGYGGHFRAVQGFRYVGERTTT